MKTLDLIEAAKFLKLTPEVLRRKAKARKVPGANTGKCWIFIEADLVDYIRSLYVAPEQALQGDRRKVCHSTNVIKRGGLDSQHQMDREYADLLGLPTESKPKDSMMN